jgi:hypothetical protein
MTNDTAGDIELQGRPPNGERSGHFLLKSAIAERMLRLEEGVSVEIRVSGESMAPALAPGDVVSVLRCPSAALALGDLAVVDLPGAGLVVHRVLWVGRHAVRTRGDGSGRMDPPIPHDRVLGRVVSVRRSGREVLSGATGRLLAWGRAFTAAAARHAFRRIQLAASRFLGERRSRGSKRV